MNRDSERIPRCLSQHSEDPVSTGRRGQRAKLRMDTILTVKIPRGEPRGGFNSAGFDRSSTNSHRVLLLCVLLGLPAMLMVLWVGCATVGRDFPVSRVSEIQIGKTTRDDIRAVFGAPWRVGIEDGKRTWTYGKYRYTMFGQKEAQDLVVRFDEQGVVTSYTFSTTKTDE